MGILLLSHYISDIFILMKRRLLWMFLATLAFIAHGNTVPVIQDGSVSHSEETNLAIERVKELYIKKGKTTDDYEFRATIDPIGVYRVKVIDKWMSPAFIEIYLVDANGNAVPGTLKDQQIIFQNHQMLSQDVAAQADYIQGFMEFYNRCLPWGKCKLIGSIQEIPDYAKAPLEADVENAIRPMWQRVSGKECIWTLYTYTQLGGQVERFCFVIHELGDFTVETTVLGKDIGAAQYLR